MDVSKEQINVIAGKLMEGAVFEELSKTNDVGKFMWKIYVDFPLREGKGVLTGRAHAYSVWKVSGEIANEVPESVPFEKERHRAKLKDFLIEIMSQGEWRVESQNIQYFDAEGKELVSENECEGWTMWEDPRIARRVQTTKTETFFVDVQHLDKAAVYAPRKN